MMEGLRDIKPLYNLNDYLIFGAELLGGVMVLILIGVVIYKIVTKKKSIDKRPIYVEALKNIDYSNSKKAAYLITKNMQKLVQSEAEENLYRALLEKLEIYKYQKVVPELSDKIEGQVNVFIGVASESR
jgi:hypothetical protein